MKSFRVLNTTNSKKKPFDFRVFQVRKFYERAAQKLRDEGAFISHKIEADHDMAVSDIFSNQDLNDDNFLSPYEFSRTKGKNNKLFYEERKIFIKPRTGKEEL